MSVLLYLIRKTWGWQKQSDRIPDSQIAAFTGLRRTHVYRAIKDLNRRRIISSTKHKGRLVHSVNEPGIWKNFATKIGSETATKIGSETATKIGALNKKENSKKIHGSSAEPLSELAPSAAFLKVKEVFGFDLPKIFADLAQKRRWASPPPEVVERVAFRMIEAQDQIVEPWPWILAVFEQESRAFFAEKNRREGEAHKKAPSKIGDILKQISK